MSDQLTESQVARVVAEVTRQAQLLELDQRQTLGRQQVVQILEELKLPVDLLDPAMLELERREAEAQVQARYEEALARKRRRVFWIVTAVVAVLLVFVLVIGNSVRSRWRALEQITASQPGRITRSVDDGGNLASVTQDGSEIVYRVTLERVPLSENLSLKCNWIDPTGRVVKQNSWQTRTTDKSVWETSCRTSLGSSAPIGAWTVELLLDDRLISRTAFKVE